MRLHRITDPRTGCPRYNEGGSSICSAVFETQPVTRVKLPFRYSCELGPAARGGGGTMRSVWGANRLGMGLGVVIALLGACLLGATPALAGIGGSAVPTWPNTATVGDLLTTTTITITNTSTPGNDTESVQMTVLLLTPACVQGDTVPCLEPADQDTFKVLTAVGDASTAACAGIGFDISPPPGGSVTGEFSLVPQADVILGPATGPLAARQCQVNLTLRVFKMPNPADTPGETHPVARATLVGTVSGLSGAAGGIAEIIISKAT